MALTVRSERGPHNLGQLSNSLNVPQNSLLETRQVLHMARDEGKGGATKSQAHQLGLPHALASEKRTGVGAYLEAILEEACLGLGYFEGHGEGEMGWCGWLGRGQVGSSLESRRGARSIAFYERDDASKSHHLVYRGPDSRHAVGPESDSR